MPDGQIENASPSDCGPRKIHWKWCADSLLSVDAGVRVIHRSCLEIPVLGVEYLAGTRALSFCLLEGTATEESP